MIRRFLVALMLITSLFGLNAQAANNQAPVVASVVITKANVNAVSPQKKEVYLMPIRLTEQQKQKFIQYKKTSLIADAKALGLPSKLALPSKIDTGMNNVPVLNQGKHGACVTFAVTGALDALLGKGDYVSQLCNLELGSYLEKRSYYPSGWDGSDGEMVLDQIREYGIISKENQKTKSCAGISEYPGTDPNSKGNPMSLDDFKTMSENLIDEDGKKIFYWEPLLTTLERFLWDSENLDAEKVLIKVKQNLAKKIDKAMDTRLTFGVILFVNHGSAGACAQYHEKGDTWAMTDAITNDKNPNIAGHEMIITGYDDDAVATDDEGKKHKGLLILRNSWGDDVGDKGNYYMTYDFFKQFVLDIQKIHMIDTDKVDHR